MRNFLLKVISNTCLVAFVLLGSSVFGNAPSRSSSPLGGTVIDVSAFGLKPDTGEDATPLVRAILQANARKDGVTISFPKGRYYFWKNELSGDGVAFDIEGARNITIDGNGSTFVFHGIMQPFYIKGSHGIQLRNFNIDWSRPFITQGEVVRLSDSSVDIKIDQEKYPFTVEGGRFFGVGENWKRKIDGYQSVYDQSSKEIVYRLRDNPLRIDENTEAERLSADTVRFHARTEAYVPVGTYVALNHGRYIISCIRVDDSSNLHIKDVTIHHSLSHSLETNRVENITLDAFNILANEAEGRVFSSVADGFHLRNSKGHVLIQNLTQTGVGDDFLNIKGINTPVMTRISDTAIIADCAELVEPGDSVWLLDGKTFQRGEVYEVASKKPYGDSWRTFELTFTRKLPADFGPGDYLENKTWNADFTIRNCDIQRRHRARGILISTPGKVLVENNRFRTAGAAILIDGDVDYWYEAGAVTDVTIRNNVFEDCLTSASSTGGRWEWGEAVITITPSVLPQGVDSIPYHQNIRIVDNTFKAFDIPLVRARSVNSLSFSGNTIERTYTLTPFAWQKAAFAFDGCRNVTVSGNRYDANYEGNVIWINHMKRSDVSVRENRRFDIQQTPDSHK